MSGRHAFVMKFFALILLTLLIFTGCSRDSNNDVRNVRWGMTQEQVKVLEAADLVKEGDNILTYRLGGNSIPLNIEIDEPEFTEGESDPPEVEMIAREYDLLYVFGDEGLGMVVIHFRDTMDEPDQYMELFKERTNAMTKKIGEPAKGVASYKDDRVKADPYEDPAAICKGEYGLQHIWMTKNERTKIFLELDRKKYAPEPDCNLTIFYESLDIPVDQELSDELHDVL